MPEFRRALIGKMDELAKIITRRHEVPSATLRVGDESLNTLGLLYARGFLLSQGRSVPSIVSKWERIDVADWKLYVDPRVPVEHAQRSDREVWIIGDAFVSTKASIPSAADWVLGGDLHENIDRLGGRYLLIYRGREQVQIYHDALGSRSIFYGPGVVASHAELAAETIGAGLRDWLIPFITSRGFRRRDVKYLPGLHSPFEKIEQLTPNCRLRLGSERPERYWPRRPVIGVSAEYALCKLVEHLEALREYFARRKIQPVVGVSAGRDSRGIVASLGKLDPKLFTFVRSPRGESTRSADSQVALKIATALGLELDLIRLKAPPPLDDALTPFASTFRRNTGYVRGNNSAWVEHYAGRNEDWVFVRGSGGEIMRGFYPPLKSISAASLSHLYDVNSGSKISRDAFAHFIEQAEWEGSKLYGRCLEDLFYWEHRMGIWGASTLTEADMAFRSLPAYNSRELFDAFAGLPQAVDRRELFESAIEELDAKLGAIPYSS